MKLDIVDDIFYIEKISGFNHNGPAWIGRVKFSKSKKTIYFNDQAFKNGGAGSGNYSDIETGDIYWISHPKKNQTDRHKYGNGLVIIQEIISNEYLKYLNTSQLDSKYIIKAIKECYPIERINKFINENSETKI